MKPFPAVLSVNFYTSVLGQVSHDERRTTERGSLSYAPWAADCPSESLLRSADSGLSSAETGYVGSRSSKASQALSEWLWALDPRIPAPSKAPVLAISWSGGGFRALLMAAGALMALDEREGPSDVAGLYQALTYETGLSGGAWFLAGVAANGYPKVSTLRDSIYLPRIQDGLLAPGGLLGAIPDYLAILGPQILSKQLAGYETTIADVYGRLIGYNVLSGPQGGLADRFSDIANSNNFSKFDVPLPIVTSIAINDSMGCAGLQNLELPQMETSPFEFGSWDKVISGFTPTKYLGSRLNNGHPRDGKCTVGFDSTGFVQASSGNVLAFGACFVSTLLPGIGDVLLQAVRTLQQVLQNIKGNPSGAEIFAANYPNPFFNSSLATKDYSSSSEISLVDGGTTQQNNPVWPLLHRDVDVAFILDANVPDYGITDLYNTHVRAKASGLGRMPSIPSPQNYDNVTGPRFFGCNQKQAMTVLWLAGFDYVYPNNITGASLQLDRDQILGLMSNGRAAALGNGTSGWSTCVGCAIVQKSGSVLPRACEACLSKYCYN